MTPAFAVEPVAAADFEPLFALRMRAMRESLSALGRYDEQRARERLAATFDIPNTRHIVVGGERLGFFVFKRLTQAYRLEHLYLDLPAQRRGIGGALLRDLCARADAEQLPIELCALKGSDANRFYLRHGFVEIGEGEWDIDYLRQPLTASLRAVRTLWEAIEARDWAAARAQLHDDAQTTWWTSGERFADADAYIGVQRGFPEGWSVRLLELGALQDGRVISLTRVDHPPASHFATSLFRMDDGRIAGIDEYWATLEAPPSWREGLPGITRFDPRADPRTASR